MGDTVLGMLSDETFGPRRGDTTKATTDKLRGVPPGGATLSQEDLFLNRLIKKIDDFYRKTTVVTAPPAHNSPHFFSYPVDVSGRVTVAAAVGDWQTITSYTLENGRAARISGYGLAVNDATYTYDGSLLFRVRVNGNVVPTLDSFSTRRGTLSEPRNTFIKLIAVNDRVEFQVKRAVAALASQTVDAVLTGWTWRPTTASDGAGISLAY